MAILANNETRILIQGITGRMARRIVGRMVEYGTKVVAGVTVGRGGEKVLGIPVYDTVKEALCEHEIDGTVLFIPALKVKEAALEAIEAGIKLLVIVSEGVPIHDAMQIKAAAAQNDAWIVGPNTLGLISPGQVLLGQGASSYSAKGNIGVLSRSGTLMMETIKILTEAGFGQSTCVGIGGDQVIGRITRDYLCQFEADPDTKAVVIIGEIGGNMEEDAADFIRTMSKPVAAFIVGRFAPAQKRLGHAGAIVSGNTGSAEGKRQALREAGAFVADSLWDLVEFLKTLPQLKPKD